MSSIRTGSRGAMYPTWVQYLVLLHLSIALTACGGGDSQKNYAAPPVQDRVRTESVSSPVVPDSYPVFNLSLGGIGGDVFPKGINALGQVAGSTTNSEGQTHAFFFDGVAMLDLGTLPGGNYSSAKSINDSGQVAGVATGAFGYFHAFTMKDGSGLIDMGTLGGTYSAATDVNAAGQIVGEATNVNRLTRAFAWTQSGGMRDLGTLQGTYSHAVGINDSGQVVGFATAAGDRGQHAFSWTEGGGMVDIGTLGGNHSYANDVNASGQVIGYAYTATNAFHAFSWVPGGNLVDIGTLGGNYSQATRINDSGQVVGNANIAGDDSYHAFLWKQGDTMIDLGTLGGSYSTAVSVNKFGQVVGWAHAVTGQQHAFLWTQASGMVDLNTRIPTAPAGLELYSALAISDSGAIVASSNMGLVLLGGSSHAPVVGGISANDPVAVGAPLEALTTFADVDAVDTHTAVVTWGDGSAAQAGTVSESAGVGSVSASHIFTAAGIYAIGLTITDNTGRKAQVSRNVVVYDPAAGFATGSGWIQSPPGALKSDVTAAGRANFEFVSKYQRGTAVPSGNTAFRFQTANFSFLSDTYDWMVIAGPRAQYKGTGTINGQGSFNFMFTAIDGAVNGGRGMDRFRIKIWSHDTSNATDTVVYDNQIETTGEGTLTEGTAIAGGDIVIHIK